MIVFIAIIIAAGLIYIFLNKDVSRNKKQKKSENYIVSTPSQTEENTTSINLDEEELKKKIIKYNNSLENEALVGFYGIEQFSPNKKYSVVFTDGYFENDKWQKGQIAILHGKELLFKKIIERPHDCCISNNGITICCDWLNSDDLIGNFIVLDQSGKQIFSKKTSANLGSCGISNDGKISIFETYSSDTEDANQIFVIDIEKGKIISKFNRPTSFNKTKINTEKSLIGLIDNRNFTYEVDFFGKQTNKEEFDTLILKKGSIFDKFWFYSEKPNEEKFGDENYLDILHKATKDKDTKYSFGLDRIYRMIGEYHEANNDIKKTIDFWEKAIEINPKVGVKRKLDKLKINK
jgi:hypothetical protein